MRVAATGIIESRLKSGLDYKLDRCSLVHTICKMPLTPKDIKEDLDQVETDATFFRQRQDVNSKVRYARWDGQAEDGRKHEANLGVAPFPFEGASDARVRLSEIITNAETRTLRNAAKRSKLRIKGTEISDWGQASKSTTLLDWMVNSKMSPNFQKEIGLCSEWRQEKGSYGARIDWQQETAMETNTINVDMIMQDAQQLPEAAQLLALIEDGNLDEEAATLLEQFNPVLTSEQAKKAIQDLRENGIAEFDVPYFRINQPRVTALRVYRDVYFPTYVDDIQRSPWVAERKYYTEEEIREKEVSEGWTEEFVEEVLKHQGDTSLDHWSTQDRNKFGRQFSYEETVEDQEDLYEIYHVYYKANAQDGSEAIGVYTYAMSYFSQDVQSKESELLDYDHGLYPFVFGVREYTERGIIQSRGIGEIMQTLQGEMKQQRDFQQDRTSMDIIPPMTLPASRTDMPITLGPATKIPERRPGEINFLDMPNSMVNTQVVMDSVMNEVNAYFGKDPEDPNGNLLYQQDLIDLWLAEQKQILEQIFALMQQFMPDVQMNLVIGGQLQPYEFSREQIQGKYDLAVQFDARDLDAEKVSEKMNAISTMVLPLDTQGTVDRSGLVRRLMEWIDPVGAEELVSTPQQVSARELEDEQEALGKIGSGIEPPLDPEGKNAQMRLQVIQESVMSNPNLQQRYQEDEIYKGMVDARIQMFQQTLAQQENAQIGRVGAQPFLDEMQG